MALVLDDSGQPWPQIFCRFIVANLRYWLDQARVDVRSVLSERPQVLKGLSFGLTLPEAWSSARELTLCLSPIMIRQGHGEVWEGVLATAVTRSREENDPTQIDFELQLGTLYRLQGRLSEAYHHLKAALELCHRYSLCTRYWTLLNQLGLVARLSTHHDEALAYCQQVLAGPGLSAAEYAEALNVMGLVAYDQRQWGEALNYFEQALVLYRSLDDLYQTARVLNNRGLVLLRDGQWDKAEESYRDAIRQFLAADDDQTERFKAVMNLGNIFLMRQEYEAAIRQYREALPVFQQCHYMVDLAHIYNNLGMAYTGLSDWQTAEAFYKSSITHWQNLGDANNLANVLDNLGAMFIDSQEFEQAKKILKQGLQVLDKAADSPATGRLQRKIQERLAHLSE